MHYYMITEGLTQIDEIFFGETKNDVVEKARSLINQWPEYAALENEEIIEYAEEGRTEFDLVEIVGSIPKPETSKKELISIYQSQWGG
ncbi:MAG: hypothetical protein OIF55_15755 [Amphritea sp.]|nr:hypothetical protein [Amphritea sp.]